MLDCRVYYFHVDSTSNPADALSRGAFDDEWVLRMHREHDWVLKTPKLFPAELLHAMPLKQVTETLVQWIQPVSCRQEIYI